jgi:hypothetical protein
MVAGGRQDQRVGVDQARGEDLRLGDLADETHLDVAGHQGVELGMGDHFGQHEIDVGKVLGRCRDPLPEHGQGGDGGEADADGPRRAAGDPSRHQRSTGGVREHPARFRQENAPRGCERHSGGGAFEQRDADALLEPPHLPAERRLGHLEPGGGPSDVPFLGDRHETA